jgi:UDP-N-acetylmuramate dehydrogenase
MTTLGCGLADRVLDRLGGLAERDAPLAPLTTYRVGGTARALVRARSVDDLRLVADAVRGTGCPVLVMGRGSNLLVADAGFEGVAVVLEFADHLETTVDDAAGTAVVVAGAGVALPVLARQTAAAGLTGLEWAVGVPGSVGGAVRMNAGGHGSDIATSLVEIHRFDLRSGHDGAVPASALGLRFRGSALTDDDVVLSATFGLTVGDRATAEEEIAGIVRWRRERQPGGQNAGSVFVNPVPGVLAAAQLSEACALRGWRHGSAHVSAKHANFVQADPGGSADDVHHVVEHVRAEVAHRLGIALRSEIRLVGFTVPVGPEAPGGGSGA